MNYLPHTDEERKSMMDFIGIQSEEELFSSIPENLKDFQMNLPRPLSEIELLAEMKRIAAKNRTVDDRPCFLGAGAYRHFIPSALEAIISRAEFYTCYTPYQPEISQGTLQSIFEFQTAICELTGMDVANASMYDGATAAAEAALMTMRITGRNRIVASKALHPEYLSVIRTYLRGPGAELRESRLADGAEDLEAIEELMDGETAAFVVQVPNFFGIVDDLTEISKATQGRGGLLIVCTDLVSLALLKPPAEYGADICVGDGQPAGNALSFGGPYVGFLAAKEEYLRQMPGRIVGETLDSRGNRAFVLTLQTREQHIRRQRATSNICSNQALNALAVTVYLSLLGRTGLRTVAEHCLQKAHFLAERATEVPGFKLTFQKPFSREFTLTCPLKSSKVNRMLLERGIVGGFELARFFPDLNKELLLCTTELTTREDIEKLISALKEVKEAGLP